jgi:hypothetical protein
MDSNKTFIQLKSVLSKYEKHLHLLHNSSDNYYLTTLPKGKSSKGEFFGAVQIKKSYVAFHLMPLYYEPSLLDNISITLKNRMQGKSCFNFKEIDSSVLKELMVLTKHAFNYYRSVDKI